MPAVCGLLARRRARSADAAGRREALQASALGLHITLSHDPSIPEGARRTYVLMGGVRDDIEAEWDIGVPVISISRYILGVLTIADGEGWYIASEAELRAEAGLPAD